MAAEKIQELTPKDQVMALVAEDCVDTAIATLNEKYKGLKAVDEDSFVLVKKGHKEFVSRRTSIDDRRLSLKRDIDIEAKRITALLAPGEAALKKEKDAWEDKIKAKAAEDTRIEQARIDKIKARISSFSTYSQNLLSKTSDELKSDLDFLKSIFANDDFKYGEFINEAEKIKFDTEQAITKAYENRKTFEDMQAQIAAQQAVIDEANRIVAEKARADKSTQQNIQDEVVIVEKAKAPQLARLGDGESQESLMPQIKSYLPIKSLDYDEQRLIVSRNMQKSSDKFIILLGNALEFATEVQSEKARIAFSCEWTEFLAETK